MADPMPVQLLATLGSWATTYLVHSAVLLGLVWIVTRLPGLPPVVHDVFWKTALVAGVVTATGALGSSLTTPTRMEVVAEARTTEAFDVGERVWNSAVSGAEMQTTVAVTPGRSGGTVLKLLLTVWLVGATVGSGRLLLLRRRALLLRGHFSRPAPRTRAIFDEMSRGVVGAEVVCCDAVAAPCVLPGRTIALPRRCEEEMSDAEMRAVLGHELAHVARDDVRWSGFLRALSTVLWIQPLNRYALARVREAAELICDDWAVSRTGDSYGLAQAIARVAEWATGEPAYGVSMAGSTRRLSDRVHRILRGRPVRPSPRWLPPVFVGLLLLPALWLPVVSAGVTHHEVRVERHMLMVADTLEPTRPDGRSYREERRIVIAAPWRG